MKIKKILCIFLNFCIVSTISGCFNRIPGKISNNPDTENACTFIDIMIGDTDIEEWHENNVISRVQWQKLRLSESHSAMYPSLSSAFDKYNEESLTEAKALMYEFTPFVKEMKGEEYNPVYCQAEAEIYMQRADNHIVSFLERVEKYTGGIHPDFFVSGINYNPDTGEKVALTDIITDTKDLPSILEKKITEKYSDVVFHDLNDTFSKYKTEEFTWTLDYQGITFWFSPYEIAAYSVGTLSAKIRFDEFADMFNKEYFESPENYVMSLPVGLDTEFDLTADDGVMDSVYTEKVPDRYGSYYMLRTTVNGNTYTDEINYAYDFDVYLVHTGNRNYIYSDSKSDNDYHMLCVLDINDGKVQQIKECYGTQIYCEYIEEGFESGTVYRQAFNNPEKFSLTTRFDILGTRDGIAQYKINETDGTPEMTDEAYNIESEYGITSRIPLEVELLPDKVIKEIPEATVFYPLRTDGKTYIDMKSENGQEVRFQYDTSEYLRKVNGIAEDECFENLLYAG